MHACLPACLFLGLSVKCIFPPVCLLYLFACLDPRYFRSQGACRGLYRCFSEQPQGVKNSVLFILCTALYTVLCIVFYCLLCFITQGLLLQYICKFIFFPCVFMFLFSNNAKGTISQHVFPHFSINRLHLVPLINSL